MRETARSRFAQRVQREQTAARGAVMAGAKRQRRFDFDADAIARNKRAVVPAMNDETSGDDRRQAGETGVGPVRSLDLFEAQRLRRVGPCRGRNQPAQGFPIRRVLEIDRHIPQSAARLGERGRDVVAVEGLGDDRGDPPGGLSVDCQPCDGRRTRAGWH